MIVAAILAAGGSVRLGSPKQLAVFRGTSLVAAATETALASRCDRVCVVVGAFAEQVKKAVQPYGVEVVENPHWAEGKSSSVKAAVAAPGNANAEAILFLTCDQPHLKPELLNEMVDRFRTTARPIACTYAGTVGVPFLVPRQWFTELLTIRGEQGSKALLPILGEQLITVPWAEGAIDVDTDADLKSLREEDRDSATG